MSEPVHGRTKHGLPVHLRTFDHHRTDTAYQRFNQRFALALTNVIGTMTTFYVFCLLALCSLPAVLSGFSVFSHTFPAWMIKASIIALVAWVAQTFLQLVLLPSLMVGQNLQNAAADARSAKTFEDTEKIIDGLNLNTQGGLTDAVAELKQHIDTRLREITGAQAVQDPPEQQAPSILPCGDQGSPGAAD